jgi:hypothetical protein
MGNNNINGKIAVKQKEISVEQDPNKKAKLNNDLQILNLRKQIISFQERIEQIRNSF